MTTEKTVLDSKARPVVQPLFRLDMKTKLGDSNATSSTFYTRNKRTAAGADLMYGVVPHHAGIMEFAMYFPLRSAGQRP